MAWAVNMSQQFIHLLGIHVIVTSITRQSLTLQERLLKKTLREIVMMLFNSLMACQSKRGDLYQAY
nr:hypothetical protein Iba_chr14cCG6650 [Ipomoea batatas]